MKNANPLTVAHKNLRTGDYVSLWEATVSHRYAGTIAEYDTPAQAEKALLSAGFTLRDKSPYLPSASYTV